MALENEINHRIRLNTEVHTQLMCPEDAQETGAMALFGEKYEDEVRVVSMGGYYEPAPNKEHNFSIELCGGTHVSRTGDIGLLKIISDTGIAAGVRRIEAITGPAALSYLQALQMQLTSCAEILKSTPDNLVDKIDALSQEKRRLEKDLKALKQKMAGGSKATDSVLAEDIQGIKFLHKALEDVSANDLKPIADQLKKQLGSGVIMLTSVQEGKVSVVIAVTTDHTPLVSAVDLVRIASEALGGKGGGGRPDMAQAGGTTPAQIPQAAQSVKEAIEKVAKDL